MACLQPYLVIEEKEVGLDGDVLFLFESEPPFSGKKMT